MRATPHVLPYIFHTGNTVIGKALSKKKKIRSSPPEVFLGKGTLKICSKVAGEQPCRSVISVKLLCHFVEITLQHGCSPVNLLPIFRTPFPKSTSRELLLNKKKCSLECSRHEIADSTLTWSYFFNKK